MSNGANYLRDSWRRQLSRPQISKDELDSKYRKMNFDPKYRKMNPERASWWERFDALPADVKQLIWDSPDEPTPAMLLVAEELSGELLLREEPKFNAKQCVRSEKSPSSPSVWARSSGT